MKKEKVLKETKRQKIHKNSCVQGKKVSAKTFHEKEFSEKPEHLKKGKFHLRTFAPIVSVHPYCFRKSTCHVMHERAR